MNQHGKHLPPNPLDVPPLESQYMTRPGFPRWAPVLAPLLGIFLLAFLLYLLAR